MAAPSTVTRVDPTTLGRMLEDGYSTKIAFAVDPDIEFWEKTVQPPGVDGGEKIETTTMFNSAWRTFAARHLKTLTGGQTKVAYDPVVYNQIITIINVPTSVTVTFPDGSTLDFFGYLQKFEPDDLAEGTHPEATVSFEPTNYDPVNAIEAAPVMTEVAGT